ncbi:hypothetical protein BB561_005871 [Smittium simulii]|uniref:SDH assembly factor 2 n=1 Tax=Smittium simulii TaxID=133385 RepID=A0A2T9Y7Z5_9FUNG|nr:hypothetical protein BB561_005871 [Smittium simulii]
MQRVFLKYGARLGSISLKHISFGGIPYSGRVYKTCALASTKYSMGKLQFSTKTTETENKEHETLKRRIIWQTRKRGILESDLLLSAFVSENINTMSKPLLLEFDQFISEHNDWDLFHWISGAKQPSTHIQRLEIFQLLVAYVSKEAKLLSNSKLQRMPNLEEIKN